MITVSEILHSLAELAPMELAESWDNVGLLVGDLQQQVQGIVVALDASADVLDQLSDNEAELLVVHHPLIFSGMKRLVEDGGVNTLLRRLIYEGHSLIALHTNLDSAPHGLNQYVAEKLGLVDICPLLPNSARPLLKLVVFVPESHQEELRAALCAAGAGQIGHYSDCTFSSSGQGTFRPMAGSKPYIGETGVLESVTEQRLEMVVAKSALAAVLNALKAVHPYEVPAYDILPQEIAWPGAGLGRIGRCQQTVSMAHFAAHVDEVLSVPRIAMVGDPSAKVSRVALCTGSGGDFLPDAIRAGADLYLTGELKHHQALLARQQGIAVLDIGHFASERPAVPLLADYLEAKFPLIDITCAEEVDPLQ